MPLSSIEIKNKTFAKSFGGYNREEVKVFLTMISKEMEELRNERLELAQKADELSVRLNQYEKTEGLLKETLVTAQKATNDIKDNAKKEADLIISKARADSENLKRQTQEQVQKLQEKISELEAYKFNLLTQLKSLIASVAMIVDRELGQKDKIQK
ncbi:MAG: DivIVA domain-containing protein [Candidatus Latescibacteria bacterium]|nr:DivIVA domain-containing protein [Candidatus Latescibacterota bacterium]